MRTSLSTRRRRRFILPAPCRWGVTVLSAIACVLGTWVRLPGMVLAGVTVNWPVIWMVAWSANRPAWHGAIAGVAVGLVQDGLTHSQPTHALSLALVGFLTARLQKERFVREDFVSVALIVFGMTVLTETVMALQWTLLLMGQENSQMFWRSLGGIWQNYRSITLSSAILSSLWTPALSIPLNWIWLKNVETQFRSPQK